MIRLRSFPLPAGRAERSEGRSSGEWPNKLSSLGRIESRISDATVLSTARVDQFTVGQNDLPTRPGCDGFIMSDDNQRRLTGFA